jgi:hypothetical protein
MARQRRVLTERMWRSRQSGVTVAEFRNFDGVSSALFYVWQRRPQHAGAVAAKAGLAGQSDPDLSDPEQASFVPSSVHSMAVEVQIDVADGVVLRLPLDADEQLLRSDRRRERFDEATGQRHLFGEPEGLTSEPPPTDAAEPEVTAVSRSKRRRATRKVKLDHLPQRRIEHDVPDTEKVCGCGRKNEMFLGHENAGRRAAVVCTDHCGGQTSPAGAVGLSDRRASATGHGRSTRPRPTAPRPLGDGASAEHVLQHRLDESRRKRSRQQQRRATRINALP